jgi:hypothetical protein
VDDGDEGFDFPPTAHPGRELFTGCLFVLLVLAHLVGWLDADFANYQYQEEHTRVTVIYPLTVIFVIPGCIWKRECFLVRCGVAVSTWSGLPILRATANATRPQ